MQWIGIHALKGEIHPVLADGVYRGGLALIAGHIRDLRDERKSSGQPEPLVFATNSTIHGSALAFLSRGEAVVNILNAMGVDAVFVDSREFSFGSTRLSDLARIAVFPFVAANIVQNEGAIPEYLDGYFLDEHSRTAFIGLSSPLLLERNLPMFVEGLSLLDPETAIENQIRVLGSIDPPVERIVVMAVGYKTGGPSGSSFVEEFLAIDGVDCIVVGQRDDTPAQPETRIVDGVEKHIVYVNDSLFDQGRSIDAVTVENGNPAQSILEVNSSAVTADAGIGGVIFNATAPAQEMLREELGTAPVPIPHIMNGESPLANYVLDLYREYTGAELAVLNSGALREGFDAGPISIMNAYETMPFQNSLVTLEASGADLLRILERSALYYGDPQNQNGFLQVSGIEYAIQIGGGENRLVRDSILIRGQPLDEARVYTLATEIFLANGGDGYSELSELRRTDSLPVLNFSVFVDGIRTDGTVRSGILDRIIIRE